MNFLNKQIVQTKEGYNAVNEIHKPLGMAREE